MNRKLVSLYVLTVLLVFTFGTSLKVQKVEASGTIYIRADGSIDPPIAPISTSDNVTYTFAGNINDSIVVERDNIVLDGPGYTVEGGGSGTGIDLSQRNNVTVKNTTIKNFYYGMYLNHTNKIALINNNIANNGIGILLNSSLISIVSGNNITNNDWAGVGLISSSNNSISGNNITNNTWDGIGLTSSSNSNSISRNNIANNHDGIYLSDSSSNSIYHNNFRDNTQQEDMLNNTWDHGYPSGGNYWSDYNWTDLYSGSYQNETGSDGIGDTEYAIDGNNTDHYPLMGMFSEFDWISLAAPEQRIQTVCNSTISDLVYNGTAISFDVTGDNGTSGFCRIHIPKVFMNSTFAVFVNGTEIAYTLLPCSTSNYSYLYFNYTHSTEDVIIIPEFPSSLILSLFMITTLLAVIVSRRKHAFTMNRG